MFYFNDRLCKSALRGCLNNILYRLVNFDVYETLNIYYIIIIRNNNAIVVKNV